MYWIRKSIYLTFAVFIWWLVYGSLRSTLLDTPPLAAFLVFPVFCFCICFILTFYSPRMHHFFYSLLTTLYTYFSRHRTFFTVFIFSIVIVCQIIILGLTTAPIGWDVGAVFNGVTHMPASRESIGVYLSQNPNNAFFFFLTYFIKRFVNLLDFRGAIGNHWFTWQFANTVWLDIGFVLLFKTGKLLFSKKAAYIAFFLSLCALGLSPYLLVPYTDTTVFTLTSLIFYLYALLKIKAKRPILLVALIGCLTVCNFLLKPSAIIFLIAFFIVQGMHFLTAKGKLRFAVSYFLIFVCASGGTFFAYRWFESTQQIVVIDRTQAKPWQHFMMMGLTGRGGYNTEDTQHTNQLQTQNEKKAFAKQVIVQRLKERGFFGYWKFLFEKYAHNTANGDFGWGKDGMPQEPYQPDKHRLQSIFRASFYQQGQYTNNVRFVMHLCWLVTLVGLVLTLRKQTTSNTIAILQLAIIGAMLFLLLFEGGRSRYLIQFLPIFYLLSAYGWSTQSIRLLQPPILK